ncbi:hypothetical protein AAW01_09105 [Aurantiacibacter gangjinensis]|uniref:NlpC/P60 domain-containing protein n=2 Tax=Aurantiacibacter gangjinensis TaxID=502682 RepID=A0A0G9MND8_9SPHN|nr:hypothetical protein AAW01_09105 [Aurantiacibacter gangjinensis]
MRFAEAATQLIGTPFRFRGRDTASGVDCVGLVALALSHSGHTIPPLPAYRMRTASIAQFDSVLARLPLRRVEGVKSAGDIILLSPSASQLHLAIIGERGDLIHAHAGLGRVVASPPTLAWPSTAHWRLVTD